MTTEKKNLSEEYDIELFRFATETKKKKINTELKRHKKVHTKYDTTQTLI